MRAVLFIVGCIVLGNIVVATFFWPAAQPASGRTEPVANAATRQGQDPWMVNERYNAPNRDHIRKGVLETLDKPWASFCTPEGHKHLIGAVNNYYYQRTAQAWSYGNTYGEAARRYALAAWTTSDDNRIQRMIGDTYGRGYFSLNELQSAARTALAAQVKGASNGAAPCAN